MKRTLPHLFLTLLFLLIPSLHAGVTKLKPGDEVQIEVVQEKDLNTVATLTPNGEVSLLYIGMVNLNDKTVNEASDMIRKAYADGWLVNPTVVVKPTKIADEFVYVDGAVINPQPIVIPQGQDLGLDLATAIARAGSFTSNADKSRIEVTRGTQKKIYDWRQLVGKNAVPVPLINGDSIRVGVDPNAGATVSVIGQVANSIPIPLTPQMTAEVAIGMSGGRTASAAKKGLTITRKGRTFDATGATTLQPGDVVTVLINPNAGKFVEVGGLVNRPGNVKFNLNGVMTLREAIGAAGGIARSGNAKEITVTRSRDGRTENHNLAAMRSGKIKMARVFPGDAIFVQRRNW